MALTEEMWHLLLILIPIEDCIALKPFVLPIILILSGNLNGIHPPGFDRSLAIATPAVIKSKTYFNKLQFRVERILPR